MQSSKEFPFERARRISNREVAAYRRAIEKKLGVKRAGRGRPPKSPSEKYQAVAIRLHPKVLKWAKAEAKKRHLGYQTVINEFLLAQAA